MVGNNKKFLSVRNLFIEKYSSFRFVFYFSAIFVFFNFSNFSYAQSSALGVKTYTGVNLNSKTEDSTNTNGNSNSNTATTNSTNSTATSANTATGAAPRTYDQYKIDEAKRKIAEANEKQAADAKLAQDKARASALQTQVDSMNDAAKTQKKTGLQWRLDGVRYRCFLRVSGF
jgi:hypothetical protein